MNAFFDDLERALTDLLQMGLATAGPDMAKRLGDLSGQCEASGLHTGASLFSEIARMISERSHTVVKTDLQLTAAVCRAEHYITLCRSRMTEEDIRRRWQEGGAK